VQICDTAHSLCVYNYY